MKLELTGLVCAAALLSAPTLLAAAKAAEAETDLLVTGRADDYNPKAPLLVQEPEGHPADDYNSETPIIWADQSVLPVSVECIIAFVWICMVAFMPLAVIFIEGKSITKTQMSYFAAMWTALLGSVYLFNQVLLFQSAHFKTRRSLTIVECVYLMTQVITTVGYGDITPANQQSQFFVALFTLFSLFIIANIVSEVGELITARAEAYAEEMQRIADRQLHEVQRMADERLQRLQRLQQQLQQQSEQEQQQAEDAPGEEEAEASDMVMTKSHSETWKARTMELPPLPWQTFLKSLGVYSLFFIVGAAFFVSYPGENKTILQSCYMAVITLSTVGFGEVTPVTEGGKVFGAFWMLFGSAALVGVLGHFAGLMVMMKQREQFKPEAELAKVKALIDKMPEEFGYYTFLRFGLIQKDLMKQCDLDMLEKAFSHLDTENVGTITKDAARKFLDLAS